MSDSLLAPVRAPFRALALVILPETAALDAAGWQHVEEVIEKTLATRPAAMRRQLQLLIRALDLLPLLRHGRRLGRLDRAQALRFLEAVQDAPLLLLRRGLWGLRTLIFMGYYTRPEAAAAIGYRADRRGWEARR